MSKYLILTFIFLISIFFAEFTLLGKGGDEIGRAFENFQEAPRPIKTLILGHCEAASAIAPAYLGDHVFNFAINDMNFFYTRKILQQVVKKSDLESVVISVNPLMLMGRYNLPAYTQRYLWLKQGLTPSYKDMSSVLLSFGNHAKLFNDQLNEIFFKEKTPVNHHLQYSSEMSTAPLQEIDQDTYYQDGFRALTPSFDSEKVKQMLDGLMKNFDLTDGQSESDELFLILSLLKESSTKTTILLLPQVTGLKDQIEQRLPGAEKKLQDTLSAITKQFPGIRIHDFRANHNIPDDLFAEPNLISAKGADILGVQLRNALSEQR